MKILLIEDEPELAENIISYLTGEDYLCEHAATYAQAVDKIDLYMYDCILLDLMLPGGDGSALLQELKKRNKEDGVIIISAKNSLDDKISGLQSGADDYLAKPFHLSELAARVYAVVRRKKFGSSNLIEINELSIDLPGKSLRVHGQEVILTRKEFDLLLLFTGNKNRVISKSAVAEHLSGEMADMLDNHDFIYTHIKNLKKKLQDAGCRPYLKTIYGTGYKWEI